MHRVDRPPRRRWRRPALLELSSPPASGRPSRWPLRVTMKRTLNGFTADAAGHVAVGVPQPLEQLLQAGEVALRDALAGVGPGLRRGLRPWAGPRWALEACGAGVALGVGDDLLQAVEVERLGGRLRRFQGRRLAAAPAGFGLHRLRLGLGERRRGRRRPGPAAAAWPRGPAAGACAAWVCGACTAGRLSVNGRCETMLIGTDEPIGWRRLAGHEQHQRQHRRVQRRRGDAAPARRLWVGAAAPSPARSRRRPPLARRAAGSAAASAPDDGPPVSVIRLMLVKPDGDSAAITWATMA